MKATTGPGAGPRPRGWGPPAVTYGDLKGVGLDGLLRAAAQGVSGEADGVNLRRAAEGHLSRRDRRLRGLLVVAVDEVGGQQDGDDEGEEQSRGHDGPTHVVTDGL